MIETIGVVGAGVMGTGVAQALATTGHHVLLIDVSTDALAAVRPKVLRGLRLERMLSRRPAPSSAGTLKRITLASDLGVLAAADFVIENVTERWEIKRDVYRHLDAVCCPGVCFGVNTSAIPITRVASATRRPERVIGMHFMNPAPVMPMVELIRGHHTDDDTVARARTLVRQMGKDGIVVRDSPGFVTNRVMMLTVNEAIFLLHEQVASAPDIDRLFKTCFGHRMGPLETADLIGLDTILYSLQVLYEHFNDPKYRPCTLLARMVDAGLHGRKSGEGFYRYANDQQEAAAS